MLSFAAQFPDQVAGMVLLASTAPKPGPAQPTNNQSVAQLSYGTLPPRSRDEARANSSTAPHLGSYIEEFLEGSASVHQAASLTDLGGKPLIVHAADRNADDEWQSQQDRLATLSTNSLHRHTDATHASLLEDEADSAAASQAIDDVVAAVRTSQPLPPR
jgi:pimeloyl-ACP methyl ester carboxylesterase